MASKLVRFYYDLGSPYSYIAACRIVRLAPRRGVEVAWRPFLLGGVFRAAGNTMPAAVPARGRYMLADLKRWAAREEIPFVFSSSFPHNTLLAMRVLTAADADELVPLSLALFRAAWAEDRDIGDRAVLVEVLGDRADALLTRAQDRGVKDRLRATTDAAVAAGAFGAPTFVVGDALFWGNDRLDWALDAAAKGGESEPPGWRR